MSRCIPNIARQHGKGKLTAHERISLLFDANSFRESQSAVDHRGALASNPGESVVIGTGRVYGRTVGVFAQDFTRMGGTLSEYGARKIVHLMSQCERRGRPVVGLFDSGGARVQEGVDALFGFGTIFQRIVLSTTPQIAVVQGPCAGGAAYAPALMDHVTIVDQTSSMFVTGPKVISAVTNESIDADTLGGSRVHASQSGVAHQRVVNDLHAMRSVRDLLTCLHPIRFDGLRDQVGNGLHRFVPDDPRTPYDVRSIIDSVLDAHSFSEWHAEFARNIVVGIGRHEGRPVAVVANQPMVLAGCIDIDAAKKAAGFLRTMTKWGIPILTLVDTPGFLPGSEQEHRGLLNEGARLIEAFVAADTALDCVTITLRKSYGGAHITMGSRSICPLATQFAWPAAEINVMGQEGADVLGLTLPPDCHPPLAVQRGMIDGIIDPNHSRVLIGDVLFPT